MLKGVSSKSPKKKQKHSSQSSRKNSTKAKAKEKKNNARKYKRNQGERNEDSADAIDPEGLPMTTTHGTLARVGVISMFDGVGSVYHVIRKKLGKPPAVYIAAEIDPVLRRLVAAELGLREGQQWGYTIEGVAAIYVKDVWELLNQDSLILRQAKAMYPSIKWIVIAGSPCQDLTYAGYLNGLLGLTGKRSMLFFVVYLVICHLQILFGVDLVRYLTENAGSMQTVQTDRKPKAAQQLEHSEHFQMFLYCLGLSSKQPVKQWIWDTSPYYGIQRKRVFLRSHLDTAAFCVVPVLTKDERGPLLTLTSENLPLAPLLRTRGYTSSGALKLSWTGYQPCALIWEYAFFGGKKSFALLLRSQKELKFRNCHGQVSSQLTFSQCGKVS